MTPSRDSKVEEPRFTPANCPCAPKERPYCGGLCWHWGGKYPRCGNCGQPEERKGGDER